MIAWVVYILIGLILFFVLYLAILGVNRGVEAKNKNKKDKLFHKEKYKNNITAELKKLKNLYDSGVINKKEFNSAKKKLLS